MMDTNLKTVNARQVSVSAYQLRSTRCSVSAALRVPKNIFLNLIVRSWHNNSVKFFAVVRLLELDLGTRVEFKNVKIVNKNIKHSISLIIAFSLI